MKHTSLYGDLDLFKEGNLIRSPILRGKLKGGCYISTKTKLMLDKPNLFDKLDGEQYIVYKDEYGKEKYYNIDQEIAYIKQSKFELYLPKNQMLYVDKLILRALKNIDYFYKEDIGWIDNFLFYGPSKLIYQLYNFDKLTPKQREYIRELFEYNPIKIRLYIAQINYFIRKHINHHIILSRSPLVHFEYKEYVSILKEQLEHFKDDEDMDLIGALSIYI